MLSNKKMSTYNTSRELRANCSIWWNFAVRLYFKSICPDTGGILTRRETDATVKVEIMNYLQICVISFSLVKRFIVTAYVVLNCDSVSDNNNSVQLENTLLKIHTYTYCTARSSSRCTHTHTHTHVSINKHLGAKLLVCVMAPVYDWLRRYSMSICA